MPSVSRSTRLDPVTAEYQAYLRGEKAMPPEDRAILAALTRKSGYLTLLCRTAAGEPYPFYPYQRYFFDITHRFAGMDKSRQGGGSQTVAADALGNAQTIDGSLSLLVSYNLDEAMEKIRRVMELYEYMPAGGKKRVKRRTKMYVEFQNGSRILAVYRPRGFGPAFVYLDEAAFYADGDDILRAAVFVIMRGGYIRMLSTHFGKRNVFWRVRSREGGQYRNWLWVKVPWWHCPALCVDVEMARRVAPHLTTEERVESFGTRALKDIFESMPIEDFQQECECTPVDDTTAYFTEDLIRSVEMDAKKRPAASLQALRKLALPLVAGYDVGRKGNTSELTVFSQESGDILEERYFKTYDNEKFDEQKQELRIFMLACPLAKIAVDRTGIGEDLAESLKTEFGDRVMDVHFGSGNIKERMVVLTRLRMERGMDAVGGIRLIRDRERFRQIHSIRRKVGEGGKVKYDAAKEGRSHGDKFFSQALAVLLAAGSEVSIAEYVASSSRILLPEMAAIAEPTMSLGPFANLEGMGPDKVLALEDRFARAMYGVATDGGLKKVSRDSTVRVYADGRISHGWPEAEPDEDL